MRKACMTIIFSLLILASAGFAEPSVVNGVLDLRGQNLDQPLSMRGEWGFQWQNQGPVVPIGVPGSWYQEKRYNFDLFGYGSYHLQVLVDEPLQQMAVSLPEIWSASRIVLDGEERAVFGRPGPTRESYQPGTGMGFFVFTPKAKSFDLTIEVANYDIFLSGISLMPTIGRATVMIQDRDRMLALDLVVVGALFIIGIYHLCLFALRTEDPSTFWFAIVCFFVMIYTGAIGSEAMITVWHSISYDWRLRALNFSWMMATHAFIWFAYYLFQPYFKKRMALIAAGIATTHHIMALTTPPIIFVNGSLAFQFVIVPVLGYTCWVAWKSRHLGKEGSRIFLGGILVLVLAVINDMLSIHRTINTPIIGGFGVLAFVVVQSYLLAHRFSSAFVRVKSSEREIRHLSENLQDMNENLEKTVEDKTRDIRSIMEHIPIGIFIMSGNTGIIARDHSRQLTQIFSKDGLEGMEGAELLFAQSHLSEDEKSQAVSAIYASLNELEMNFDVNIRFFPLELRRRDADGFLRIFDLTWDKIVNVHGMTEKILVTIRDITELKGLQDKAMVHQEELEIIGEILNIPPNRFNRFIRNAQDLLAENEKFLRAAELGSYDAEVLKLLFINIHTIKGAARSLYFRKMTDTLHAIEQEYAQLKKAGHWDLSALLQDQLTLTLLMERYDRIAREKLGRAASDRLRVDFSLDEVQLHYQQLQSLMGDGIPEGRRASLEAMASRLLERLHTPVSSIMKEICSVLPGLARDLQKENPMVHIQDNGILATPQVEDLLHQTFIHILRNSLDHGIESSDERRQSNKMATPSVSVHFHWQDDFVTLSYWDDGRGLDLSRLRAIAAKNKLLEDSQLLEPQTLADLLFTANLSTARSVTDISGRGVGMGAIRQYVEQNGGRIYLRLGNPGSSSFVPFRLEMQLPSRFFAQSLPVNRVQAAS